jgi:hypothetical protein
MEEYIKQLLADIDEAAKNLSWPYPVRDEVSLEDWLSPDEENATAPVRNLQEWTGITTVMLPPANLLSEDNISQLIKALNKLLDACNCHFVLQIQVPEPLQYETMRLNWDQEVKIKQWHMGFFEMCKSGTQLKSCALGEYCQCAFYTEFFSGMIAEDLSPEEERARELEIEIQYIKRKYGNRWMKYYPYHLDKHFDDENGEPYNYGVSDHDDDDDEDDNWWKE